jgi:hypothetical protein
VLLLVLRKLIELIEKNTQWQSLQSKKSLNNKLVHCLIEENRNTRVNDEEIIKKL